MFGVFEILLGIAAVALAFYYYATSNLDYWRKQGVPGPTPLPLWGNFKDIFFRKVTLFEFLCNIYNDYKNEPVIGIFERNNPLLIVKDLDAIKTVLIKDFSKFAERGFPIHERTEPLSPHLFSLEAARWRPMRTRLSPVFTSGKLKEMFHLILECSDHLDDYLEKVAAKGEPVEFREIMAKYTTDVIGSCAFGLEMNALANEDCEFRQMGKKVFHVNKWRILRMRIRDFFPRLYDLLGYIIPPTEETTFFMSSIRETLEYRKKHNVIRHDFVDVLLDLKENPDKLGNEIKLTENLITAQAFVFFVAGFETSSTTISHALYELALNQNVQDKLRQEIRAELAKDDNKLTYDGIKRMKYLDMVFRETLRKYPPGSLLTRQAMVDYTFEDLNVTIRKGTKVLVPILGIQRDPDIYPKPDEFDPERFSPEAVAARHPMAYLPFGDGPRNCIGARFAVNQSKIGIIKVLQNYKIDVCEKTLIPYVPDPNAFLLVPKGGVHLQLIKIS